MRIAFLNPLAVLGGAERCLLDLIASLRSSAPAASMLLVCGAEGPLVERARALGVEVQVLPVPGVLDVTGDSQLRPAGFATLLSTARKLAPTLVPVTGYVTALGRVLRRWRPDVVHSNGMKHHLLGALAPRAGVPIVWHVRDFVGARPLMARALAVASFRALGAVAISKAVAADLRRCLPRLRTETVYDAIDVDEFSPGPSDPSLLDRLAGLRVAAPGTLRLGLIATYGRWKGQDLFIRASARVLERLRSVSLRFFVIGGPIYRTTGSQFTEDALRGLTRDLGLTDSVGFIPFQSDPAGVIRALEIVVHASTLPEPFGRTVAEAMACGRPVIAGECGALELVSSVDGPLRVVPGDVASLADAMERLILDTDLRQRMARAARPLATAHFSRARLAADTLRAYDRLGVPKRVE